jgi:phosphoribosylamine--glycine ligase
MKKLDSITLEVDDLQQLLLVVSRGYPEVLKRKVITGLENITDSIVFHAGTKLENGQIVSNGGRVLVTSWNNFEQA